MIRGDNLYDAKLTVLAAQHSECKGFVTRRANPGSASCL
jgi:hypothetical protein